jgi:hypothetical protein
MATQEGTRSPEVKGHFDVIVVGAGQAGLAIGYHLAQRAAASGSWRRRPSRVPDGAVAGTRSTCSHPCVTTPCRGFPSRATRTATQGETRWRTTSPTTRPPPPADRVQQPRPVDPARGEWLPGRARRQGLRSRPGRAGHRSVPVRTCPRSPSAWTPRSCSSTVSITDRRNRLHRDRCSWWAEETPATRSPSSSLARMRSTFRSDRASCRCLSAFSSRPVLGARENRPDGEDQRFADWPPGPGARHPGRLESPLAQAPTRRTAPPARHRCLRHRGDLQRRRAVFDEAGSGGPPARRHAMPWLLLPRPDMAAHARLRAARLGEGRRGVHRSADRRFRWGPAVARQVGGGSIRCRAAQLRRWA